MPVGLRDVIAAHATHAMPNDSLHGGAFLGERVRVCATTGSRICVPYPGSSQFRTGAWPSGRQMRHANPSGRQSSCTVPPSGIPRSSNWEPRPRCRGGSTVGPPSLGAPHPQPLADHAADDPRRWPSWPPRGDCVVRGQRRRLYLRPARQCRAEPPARGSRRRCPGPACRGTGAGAAPLRRDPLRRQIMGCKRRVAARVEATTLGLDTA